MPFVPDVVLNTPRRIAGKITTVYSNAVRGNITSSTTVVSGGAITFILQDLPKFASYANIYDQYRILSVRVNFLVLGATNPASGPPGYIQTAIDYDDAVVPTTANDLVNYDTLQTTPIGQFFQRTLQPRSAIAAYSGVFTSFGNKWGQWYDTASSSVIHYGIKYFIPVIPTSVYTIQPTACYQVQFRSTH